MAPAPDPDGLQPSSGELEDLVASALEALDRAGEEGLERFLAAHPEQRAQVEALVSRFRGTGLLARDARPDIPEQLGEFRLLERLGGGGMGVVFLAEQASLKRRVALKVVRPDLLFFVGTRERFQREIEVIARLSHPAIVPIVATGEHDGMPWYAMQLIEGCTVDEAVQRLRDRDPARLSGEDLWRAVHGTRGGSASSDRASFGGAYWDACVRLVRQAALGLEHAHREGVVHRDVKPSNVMLTPDGRALLLDFGLARVHGDEQLTRTGGQPGSPAYMAPEQLRGQTADERADVYSLAATLFQLLDVRAPFAAEDGELLRVAIQRGGAQLRNTGAPRELRMVLAAAMELDRERRYPSAAAFAADLDAVLARRPIAARPLPRAVRLQRWMQRHRTAAALLLAALLLAIVVPAVIAWQQGASLVALAAEKQRAERGRDQALSAVQVFLTRFASGELGTLPGGRRAGAELLDRAGTQIDRIANDADPVTLRPSLTQVGRWQVSALRLAGRAAQAEAKAREVLARWPESPQVAPVIAHLLAATRGELLRLAVDGMQVPDLDHQLSAAERELEVVATDPDQLAGLLELRAHFDMDRASLAESHGDVAGAAEQLERTVVWVERERERVSDAQITLAVLRNRLGEALFRLGRADEAQACFTRVLADYAPTGDPALGPPDGLYQRVHAGWGIARVRVQQEDWDAAAAAYEEVLRLAEHRLYCYADDADAVLAFAKIATEAAQVQRQRGESLQLVTAQLERARALFLRHPEQLQNDQRNRESCLINLQVLTEQYWAERDGPGLAAVTRDMVAVGPGDARRLSMAGLRLVQAAQFLADAGELEEAARCDDEAVAAFVACEQHGWFAPTRLDAPPFRRLVGRQDFTALQLRHARAPR